MISYYELLVMGLNDYQAIWFVKWLINWCVMCNWQVYQLIGACWPQILAQFDLSIRGTLSCGSSLTRGMVGCKQLTTGNRTQRELRT